MKAKELIELLYWGPGHQNWRWAWAFGKRDLGNVVTYYCGIFALRIRRYK